MCGIGGWIGRKDREALARMRSELRHRGPDDSGEYQDEFATLFHERLSIIDLKTGHQPMSSEDGRLWIVFNGEIYNYQELRDELVTRGHIFATQSDTETILHLYEEMGERCPERLIGMFAFAIWDSRDRTLFLARDRLGVKPLFYAAARGNFLFASELKAILAHGGVPRELDPEGLDRYLTFMYVPAPGTIIRGVEKLLPGHTLTLRDDGTKRTRRYWELPAAGDIRRNLSFGDAAARLRELLQESVRYRLISEVPLGAYISGGLDSSLAVGLMSRASNEAVNTFSVGFEERGFDERPYARRMAEAFRTNHRELVVRHHSADQLPGIIRSLDEPVADAAAIPTWFMAQLTKEHVTVVLTGEGADELFAGYSHYKIFSWMDKLSPLSPRSAARRVGRMFGSGAAARGCEFVGKLNDRTGAYLALKSVFSQAEKGKLYGEGLRSARGTITPAAEIVRRFMEDEGPYLQRLLRLDISTWLPDDLLVKVDRMTMAHAVEARVPYLDHRVVEAVMRMPPEWKLRGFVGKRILRRVGDDVLPHDIVRRRKTGFAVPVGEWTAGKMRDLVMDLLGPRAVLRRGLFEPRTVSRLITQDSCGMFRLRQLWTLVCLEIWCRAFLDSGSGRERSAGVARA